MKDNSTSALLGLLRDKNILIQKMLLNEDVLTNNIEIDEIETVNMILAEDEMLIASIDRIDIQIQEIRGSSEAGRLSEEEKALLSLKNNYSAMVSLLSEKRDANLKQLQKKSASTSQDIEEIGDIRRIKRLLC